MSGSFISLLILLVVLLGLWRKVPVFEAFLEGAKEGIHALVSILPALIAILSLVAMMRTCGALTLLCRILSPVFSCMGIPDALIPAILLRPLSGSGSVALLSEIFTSYGPDSYIGKTASVLMASTETTLYVAALYFGTIRSRRSTRIILIALLTDLFAAALASFVAGKH